MISRLLAIVVTLVAALAGCKDAPPRPPLPPDGYCQGTPQQGYFAKLYSTIIGGEPSVDRRATVFVSIGGTGYCSGTVVGPRTVLTAAHCNGDDISVIIDGQTFVAAEVMPHPDYVTWPMDDLMLLFFEQDLPTPIVADVYSRDGAADCVRLIAQGWGKSETQAIDLNESTYRVVNEYTKTLHTKQANPGGICFGDSGGPLYAETGSGLQMAGVTSTTYSQDCLIGGDHVNLAHYEGWLSANIR